MSLGVDGGGDERGAFEYGCRHGHANYDLHVLGRMRDLGTGVWVFFSSLPFSIILRAGAAIVLWVSCVSSFLFPFLSVVSWRKVLYQSLQE